LEQVSVVQTLLSLQTSAEPGLQLLLAQMSFWVQASLSSQGAVLAS